MSKPVLEPLLRSPELVEHVEELNRFIAIEHQRRRRFYEEITEEKKWEFINGEVIMHSPATNKHCRIVGRASSLLSAWCNLRGLGHITTEKALCQFPRNDYEPDIVFFGRVKEALIQDKTLLHPIPDFIVEVLSEFTWKLDRGVKFEDYQAHGVGEYWMIDPAAETIEQFILENGHYPDEVQPITVGSIRSHAIAGFEIPVRAIFEDQAHLSAMRQMLA